MARTICLRIVLMEILVMIGRKTHGADTFDTTRQGGDKAPPTPMGSMIWWLLINSSNIPNYNTSISSFNATTTVPTLWTPNGTTTIQTWPTMNFNTTTAAHTGSESSSMWSNSGDTTGASATTTMASVAIPTTWWSTTTFGMAINSSSTSTVPSSSQSMTMTQILTSAANNNFSRIDAVIVNATMNLTSETTQSGTTAKNGTSTAATPAVPASARETREPPLDQYPAACRRFDDAELYGRLKDRGGYNQYFMANTPDEVGNLPGFTLPEEPRGASDKFSDTFRRVQRSIEFDYKQTVCTGRCKKISMIVQNALDEMEVPMAMMAPDKSLARDAHDNGWSNKTIGPNDITAPLNNSAASNLTTTTMRPLQKYGLISGLCRLEHFIPIGQCDQRGSEDTDLSRLCTACRGVYKLPRGCFPQFLNAITCNSTDIHCIFDRWSKTAHGTCREETLTFTVMHNLGREECQEWRFESVEVPIACQCYLSRSSWLEP